MAGLGYSFKVLPCAAASLQIVSRFFKEKSSFGGARCTGRLLPETILLMEPFDPAVK